jgi:hypothetical protein
MRITAIWRQSRNFLPSLLVRSVAVAFFMFVLLDTPILVHHLGGNTRGFLSATYGIRLHLISMTYDLLLQPLVESISSIRPLPSKHNIVR